jgi:hypothetical protein
VKQRDCVTVPRWHSCCFASLSSSSACTAWCPTANLCRNKPVQLFLHALAVLLVGGRCCCSSNTTRGIPHAVLYCLVVRARYALPCVPTQKVACKSVLNEVTGCLLLCCPPPGSSLCHVTRRDNRRCGSGSTLVSHNSQCQHDRHQHRNQVRFH